MGEPQSSSYRPTSGFRGLDSPYSKYIYIYICSSTNSGFSTNYIILIFFENLKIYFPQRIFKNENEESFFNTLHFFL
jgi:hypothetical protein